MHVAGSLGAALALLSVFAPPPTSSSTSPAGVKEMSATGALEVSGKSLAEWKHDLTHRDASRRTRAIQAVVLFGPESHEIVPLLLERTHDRDASPRAKAVVALRMVPVDKKDVPKVIEALISRLNPPPIGQEYQAIVRYEAARTLAHFASEAQRAVPALVRASEDSSCYEMRQAALVVLRRAGVYEKGGPDPRATRAMLVALRDPTAEVRLEGIIGLGAMGRPGDATVLAQAVRALQGEVTSRDRVLGIWAYISLMALDKIPPGTLTALGALVKHRDYEVRLNAIRALGAMGKDAKAATKDLVPLLEDKDNRMAAAACDSLGLIGDDKPSVLTALINLTHHKDPTRAAAACSALGRIGTPDAKVMAALENVTKDKEVHTSLKTVAEAALADIRNPPKKKK